MLDKKAQATVTVGLGNAGAKCSTTELHLGCDSTGSWSENMMSFTKMLAKNLTYSNYLHDCTELMSSSFKTL